MNSAGLTGAIPSDTQQPLKKLPGRTKYTNITIKRGITSNLGLWEWYSEIVDNARDGKHHYYIFYLKMNLYYFEFYSIKEKY
jgi:phage tail-like protein